MYTDWLSPQIAVPGLDSKYPVLGHVTAPACLSYGHNKQGQTEYKGGNVVCEYTPESTTEGSTTQTNKVTAVSWGRRLLD